MILQASHRPRSVMSTLRGLGEICPYIGPSGGQPPVKGACTDDLYAMGVIQDNQLNCWIPKFAQALRDLGYAPKVVGTYVKPGYGNCGYTFYNVYWDVAVPYPGSGTAPCGIFVGDVYVNMDPMTVAREISGNCKADAGAALSTKTVYTETGGAPSTSNGAVSHVVAESGSEGPSTVDKILNTVTGGPAVGEVRLPSGLSAIPTWAWLAGGAAALYFLTKGGKS